MKKKKRIMPQGLVVKGLYFPTLSGDNVPSPSSYTLPPLLGSKVPSKTSSAAYTMAGRAYTGSFSEDLAKTPGPGRYDAVTPDMFNKKAPVYSMLGRSKIPTGICRISRCSMASTSFLILSLRNIMSAFLQALTVITCTP